MEEWSEAMIGFDRRVDQLHVAWSLAMGRITRSRVKEDMVPM